MPTKDAVSLLFFIYRTLIWMDPYIKNTNNIESVYQD